MKNKIKGLMRPQRGSNEGLFPIPIRPNTDQVYMNGMVPENPNEFGSAPSQVSLSRFPHHTYGICGLGAALDDGASGMDRHVEYIVPTGSNNHFKYE